MKTYIPMFLMIALCVALLFCVSCANNSGSPDMTEITSAEQTDDGDPFTFSTVSELKNAIKKNPKYYNDEEITILGTAMTIDSEVLLVDFSGSSLGAMDRYEIRQDTNRYITILIPDDVLLTVLETGDYIRLSGTVKISDGEIYLDDCEYTMIKTYEERSEQYGN